VQAALGLQIVDEAVFALAEKRPGFAKVFFYLEQEVLKPRYEIHSIGMPDIVEPVPVAMGEQRDRAARALFAATEIVSGNKFETEAGRTPPQTKTAEYSQRYYARFQQRVQQMAESFTRAYRENPHAGDLAKLADKAAVRDPWDSALTVQSAGRSGQQAYYLVRRKWPDMYCVYPHRFRTVKDLLKACNVVVSLFYRPVLTAARMPSALVELMFIDRQPEEGLLAQQSTRQIAAASLLEGLRQFVSGTASRSPAADTTTLPGR